MKLKRLCESNDYSEFDELLGDRPAVDDDEFGEDVFVVRSESIRDWLNHDDCSISNKKVSIVIPSFSGDKIVTNAVRPAGVHTEDAILNITRFVLSFCENPGPNTIDYDTQTVAVTPNISVQLVDNKWVIKHI